MTVDEIIQIWRRQSIDLNDGNQTEQIETLEKVLEFRFPDSFKSFCQLVNGFANGDWTEGMFHIWSLEEIRQEYADNVAKGGTAAEFIPFCDYLINSHQIGFLKKQLGIFKHYDLVNPICISFEEALTLIMLDAPR